MSELGIEPGRAQLYNGYSVCKCCPYGYHIDIGFVDFCDNVAKENRQPNPEKSERRERRRQRRSMQVLLGLSNPPVFWNVQQLLPVAQAEQVSPEPPTRNLSLSNESDDLKKAVQDFEATLKRTARKKSLGIDEKPNTTADVGDPTQPIPSTSFHHSGAESEESKLPLHGLSSRELQDLMNIRQQMAMSLEKIRDLESQIKTIPKLMSSIKELEQEKQELQGQLSIKTRELQSIKRYTRSLQIQKKNAFRDVGVNCAVATRDTAVNPIFHCNSLSGGTVLTRETGTSPKLTVLTRDAATMPTIELKFISIATQTESDGNIKQLSLKDMDTKITPPNYVKVGYRPLPTDKVDKASTAKPLMHNVAVEATPVTRDIAVSEDTVDGLLCDRCSTVKAVKTRSVGVGNIMTRSLSFDMPERKRTRNVGVSTLPQIKKVTANKIVGTTDFKHTNKHIGVNTDSVKSREVAVTAYLPIQSTCQDNMKNIGVNTELVKSREVAVSAYMPIQSTSDGDIKKEDPKVSPKLSRTDSIRKSKIPVSENKKKLTRQDTYTKACIERLTSSADFGDSCEEEKVTLRKKNPMPVDSCDVQETAKRLSTDLTITENQDNIGIDRFSGLFDDCAFEYDEHESHRSSQMFPESALFQPIPEKNREKLVPSKEMKAAMKVVNDGLRKFPTGLPKHLKTASSIIQQEWFKVSSTANANPLDVEDYLDSFEEVSNCLLEYVVNMVDNNGNTAMHYAVSHGNFDVVSILLDSKVCNINRANTAGYTCIMLVSLAQVRSETHREVVRRLFLLADVNIRAKQHGQTALMLAVSHGRLDMVQLLLDAGADPNIQDCDGSTALMCAVEHGYIDIVKHILAHPDTNPSIVDCDGSSALAIAMDAGHREIGVLLYAREHFGSPSRGSSPYSSARHRRSRHSSSPHLKTPTSPSVKRTDYSI